MASKNPREPKAVKKLIADAQKRQVEQGVVAWVKKLIASDKTRRNGNGGGTRKGRRS